MDRVQDLVEMSGSIPGIAGNEACLMRLKDKIMTIMLRKREQWLVTALTKQNKEISGVFNSRGNAIAWIESRYATLVKLEKLDKAI